MASINYLGLAQGLVMLGSGYWVYSQAQTGQLPCDIQNWLRKQFPSLPACTTGGTTPGGGSSGGGGSTGGGTTNPSDTTYGVRNLTFVGSAYNASQRSVSISFWYDYRGTARYLRHVLSIQKTGRVLFWDESTVCFKHDNYLWLIDSPEWQSFVPIIDVPTTKFCFDESNNVFDLKIEIKNDTGLTMASQTWPGIIRTVDAY